MDEITSESQGTSAAVEPRAVDFTDDLMGLCFFFLALVAGSRRGRRASLRAAAPQRAREGEGEGAAPALALARTHTRTRAHTRALGRVFARARGRALARTRARAHS